LYIRKEKGREDKVWVKNSTHQSKHVNNRIDGIGDFEVVHASLKLIWKLDGLVEEQSIWGLLCLFLINVIKGA
jgi:hypothetical protein